MENNDGWKDFFRSGRINDYLKYKEEQKRDADAPGSRNGAPDVPLR